MQKAQKVIVGFFIVAVLVLAGLYGYYLSKSSKISVPNEDILYYGITCPHCKIVEEYIAENNVSSKIIFKNKEVYQNKDNANELIKVGKYCKLEASYVGAVPLLFYNKTCYLGDTPIIDLLNKTLENN
jgi:glutaredoxin